MRRRHHRHAIIGPPRTQAPLYPIAKRLFPLLLLLFARTTAATTTTALGFLLPRGSRTALSLSRAATIPRLRSVGTTTHPPRILSSSVAIGIGIMGGGSEQQRQSGAKRPLSAASSGGGDNGDSDVPLYLAEGLFAVRKPLGWTSQDVVGKLRNVLETDARSRGAPDRRTKRRRPWMKVGHGGTLDPLATGVLVCGVGSGTKNLQKYLVGSKAYRAEVTLGYRTTTLDADPTGKIVEEKPFDHVTSLKAIDDVLQSQFTGKIQQIPPVFSALRRDGKKMYELAREGKTAEDLKIEPREVTIYDLKLVGHDPGADPGAAAAPIEKFVIDVECGGGTYVRSLVRDVGESLGTVATMTKLERTKQGRFLPEHCLPYRDGDENDDAGEDERPERDDRGYIAIAADKDRKKDCDWTAAAINAAIRSCAETVLKEEDDGLRRGDGG